MKFVSTFVEGAPRLRHCHHLASDHSARPNQHPKGARRLAPLFRNRLRLAIRFPPQLAGRALPGGDVVGLMGFGYLIPTLLAVEDCSTWQRRPRHSPDRAQVSIGAFLLGTLIGFSAATIDTSDVQRTSRSRSEPDPTRSPNDTNHGWAVAIVTCTQPSASRRHHHRCRTGLPAWWERAHGSGSRERPGRREVRDCLRCRRFTTLRIRGVLLLRGTFRSARRPLRQYRPIMTTAVGRSSQTASSSWFPFPLSAPYSRRGGRQPARRRCRRCSCDCRDRARVGSGAIRPCRNFGSSRACRSQAKDVAQGRGIVVSLRRATDNHVTAQMSRARMSPRMDSLLTAS